MWNKRKKEDRIGWTGFAQLKLQNSKIWLAYKNRTRLSDFKMNISAHLLLV
jgi:hypothetical protein